MLVKLAKKLIKLTAGDYNTLANYVDNNNIDDFFDFWKNEYAINHYGNLSNREIEYLFNNFDEAAKLMNHYYNMRGKVYDPKRISLKKPNDFVPKKSSRRYSDIMKDKIQKFIIDHVGENYKIVKYNDFCEFIFEDERFYDDIINKRGEQIENPSNGKHYIVFNYDNLSFITENNAEYDIIKFYMSPETYKQLYAEYKSSRKRITNESIRTRRTSDKALLEGLVNKYGKNKLVKAINEMRKDVSPITIYVDYVVDNSMQLRQDKMCFRKNGITAKYNRDEAFDNMEFTATSDSAKYALADYMLNYYNQGDVDMIEEYWPELLPYIDDCEGRFDDCGIF